jgi:excisionase family DNA binding protein
MDQMLEPLAYSVNDLARVAGLGRTTAFAEIAAGRLVATKVGRRTLVLRHDLERYLAERRAESLAGRQEAAV